jgi:hypothetical protein
MLLQLLVSYKCHHNNFVSHWFNGVRIHVSTPDSTPGEYSPSSLKIINTSSGLEDDEHLTIAKVWGNKISAPHTVQNSRKRYEWHTIRSRYGNFAQTICANQLPASKLRFVESRDVGSFIYPWIPIPATQNSNQRCAPTFPIYASELRCSFSLLKF